MAERGLALDRLAPLHLAPTDVTGDGCLHPALLHWRSMEGKNDRRQLAFPLSVN
jgi:hypothetical protein